MIATVTASGAIFGPILRSLTWLYDTSRGHSKEKIEERRRAYKEHFEPAYERLEVVHKNYMTSFHEFYDLCRKFETPPKDLVHKFRSYGMEYATWREDIRNFVNLSQELSKSFSKPKEKEAIANFSESIRQYFDVSIASGEFWHWPSWFTAFINDFEEHVSEGRSPWDDEYRVTGAKDPKGTFIKRLKSAYEVELPTKWSDVAKAKTELQKIFNA